MDFFLRLKSGGCFSTGTQSIALVTIEQIQTLESVQWSFLQWKIRRVNQGNYWA